MFITCPNCETKYNLPDEMVVPGARLNCKVCNHVFDFPNAGGQMPGQTPEPASRAAPPQKPDARAPRAEPPMSMTPEPSPRGDLKKGGKAGSLQRPGGKKSRKGCLIFFLLILLMIGGGAAALYSGDAIRAHLPESVRAHLPRMPESFPVHLPESIPTHLPESILAHLSRLYESIRAHLPNLPFGLGQTATAPAKDMISRITFRGVRQYTLVNEKIGSIIVIEGEAVNGFSEPRELIRIEASLFDKNSKLLDKKQQMAGTSVSLFQLQVLGEKELEQALGNRIEILSNNTNVSPGGKVPFMIVFFKPSEAVTEFGVTVIDAKTPPPPKK